MYKSFLLLMSFITAVAIVSCSENKITVPNDGGSVSSTVTGRVLDKAGKGIAGVKISIGDASALTDSTGKFSVADVPSGPCTVTPSKNGYYFMPQTQDITVSDMMMTMKYDFITDTNSFGNSGHGGTRGYCGQCHSI